MAATGPRCACTHAMASSSRASNSGRLSLKRWSEAFTTHRRLGSLRGIEHALRFGQRHELVARRVDGRERGRAHARDERRRR